MGGKRLLIMAGAGGVGSFVIQLAKHVGLEVVATASRPETIQACKDFGADYVINHRNNLVDEYEKLGLDGGGDYIYSAFPLTPNWKYFTKLIRPYGYILDITRPGVSDKDAGQSDDKVDIWDVMDKRVTIAFEFIFTRALHTTDMERQGKILAAAAKMFDHKSLKPAKVETAPWGAEGANKLYNQTLQWGVVGRLALAKDEALDL